LKIFYKLFYVSNQILKKFKETAVLYLKEQNALFSLNRELEKAKVKLAADIKVNKKRKIFRLYV